MSRRLRLSVPSRGLGKNLKHRKDIYMTEAFHSSPRYGTSALSMTIKCQTCKNSAFQNTYEPTKLCKFTYLYAFFCRENKDYLESA